MPERDSRRQQVRKLLAQDQEINETQLKEFRMQLELSLDSWESSAKKTRRRIVIAVAVYVATFFLQGIFTVAHKSVGIGAMAIVYGLIEWGSRLACVASFFIGVWLVGSYFFKYAPGLKRAWFDVQTGMMLELQQQVAELREEVKRRDK
jgi:hypothetical protein